jgi:hypothetical protein
MPQGAFAATPERDEIMSTPLKIVRQNEAVTLVASSGGRFLVVFLGVQIAVLGGYFGLLATAVGPSHALFLPLLPASALVVWTWSQIGADVRVVLDLANGAGRLTRISPFTGRRVETAFALSEIECFAVRRLGPSDSGRQARYALDLRLRDGRRHVLDARGSFLGYRSAITRLSAMTGIGGRLEPLPTA